MKKNTVLCGANSYLQKYYLNEQFQRLPERVRQELQIMCVLFVEDVGGVLTLEFLEDGTLTLNVSKDDADYLFDEIGSELKIREIQREKAGLLQGLESYYKTVFLKQPFHEDEEAEETEAAPEMTTEGGTNVSTEDFSDLSGDSNDTASDVQVGDGSTITAKEAEERAKSEYSSNGTYTRDADVSQDGTDYYHFKVEGQNGETSDVLVSKDGNDVVGASQNEDGSWSFNQ